MQEEGKITNIVELDIPWDDQKVCRIIEGRFDGLVDETQPFPRYERMHDSFKSTQYYKFIYLQQVASLSYQMSLETLNGQARQRRSIVAMGILY